jgi:hypothetical protein
MSAKIQSTLQMIGKQIHDLRVAKLPRFNSNQRVQLTWARVIGSLESVPESYREFFHTHLSLGQTFPYVVLSPAYKTFSSHVPEKLICIFDREIHVLEASERELVMQCYPLDGIKYVEVSSMLLDFRVKISGVTSDGMPSSSIFRCSSTTDYVFRPVLQKIRSQAALPSQADASVELDRFDNWMGLNFKFMNLARNSLLTGEKVICAILQPESRVSRFRILGRTFYKMLFPTHVCILTDRELITIREEMLQGRDDKYGSIREYIPLTKILSLSVSREMGNLLSLSIQLPDNERFEYLFQASMQSEVDQLVVRFKELTSR